MSRKAATRPTPRLACPRCRARTTREARDAVPLVGSIVSYDADCDACGATWKNVSARA